MAKILVVDDNLVTRKMIVEILNKAEHEPIGLENGEEVLTFFEKETPDLIILDLIMPVMDGMQTIEELHKNSKNLDIPIILLSEAVNEMNFLQGMIGSEVKYMTKPFSKDELLAKIDSCLDK